MFIDYSQKYPLPRASYSQFSSFLSCPWEYYLTYIAGDRRKNANKYTELGSILHDIFEKQGKQLLFENPMSIEQAFDLYNNAFMKIDKKYFDDKDDWIKMYKKGCTAIEGYFGVYSEDVPLFLEKQFVNKIGDGIPPVKSFIDRIDGEKDNPESWIITDYKSGSNPKSKSYLKDDFQLGMYAAQIYSEYGAYPKAVQFYHPVPDKFQTAIHKGEGVYEFTNQRAPVVTFSVADILIQLAGVTKQIVECVESGDWKKVVDSWSCKMCFHYINGQCKPFEKTGGWETV